MIFERQSYQEECVNNIISLLKGFDFKNHSVENLRHCLNEFHKTHKLPIVNQKDALNVDILMETGTGKTFTYINTMFALHKHYGQKKFIIFVPRKAILESVKQNITLTKHHFYTIYKQLIKDYYYTDSKVNKNIINHYIRNTDELSVLVLTNSAIDKDINIMHRYDESLFSKNGVFISVFDEIVSLKPICFIDEPHLLKGEKFYSAFKKINTLHFRFGATFPRDKCGHELSNLVYALDSMQAFNQYLVKQIRVHNTMDFKNEPGLLGTNIKSKIATFGYYHDNVLYKKDVALNDDIGVALHYAPLNGVEILKIHKDRVILSNQSIKELVKKDSYKLDHSQISTLLDISIDLHFQKEQILFDKNIKALSLYFIPNISDFRGENAFIRQEFERLYKEKRRHILQSNISADYRRYLEGDIDKDGNLMVCEGYFSGDKGSKDEQECEGVRLILGQKESLLSFDTPLRFIFSVWALQEGWDNPNIFTLTKLSKSSSDTTRHQQVGRGLRLCVNSDLARMTYSRCKNDENEFFSINYLDVLVNGMEHGFIEGLQQEIRDSSLSMKEIFRFLDLTGLQQDGKLELDDDEANGLIAFLKSNEYIQFHKETQQYSILKPVPIDIYDSSIKELLGEKFDRVVRFFARKNYHTRYSQVTNGNAIKKQIPIKQHLARDFKELWDIINKRAKLSFKDLDKDLLQKNIVHRFNNEHIPLLHATVTTQTLKPDTTISFDKDVEIKTYNNHFMQDEKHIIANLLEFAKEEYLELRFVLSIYNGINKVMFSNNPNVALEILRRITKEELSSHMLTIGYEFIDIESISSKW